MRRLTAAFPPTCSPRWTGSRPATCWCCNFRSGGSACRRSSKGWIDRVFAIGVTYGGGRWFDRGMMRGKRAILAVTIGGTDQAYSADGIYGPVADVLRPINHGILGFCGFDVVEPFIAYAPARKTDQQRQEIFAAYADRLLNLDAAPRLPMLRSDEYEHFVRKAQP